MEEKPRDGKFHGGAFVSPYLVTDMVANEIGETEISLSRESDKWKRELAPSRNGEMRIARRITESRNALSKKQLV